LRTSGGTREQMEAAPAFSRPRVPWYGEGWSGRTSPTPQMMTATQPRRALLRETGAGVMFIGRSNQRETSRARCQRQIDSRGKTTGIRLDKPSLAGTLAGLPGLRKQQLDHSRSSCPADNLRRRQRSLGGNELSKRDGYIAFLRLCIFSKCRNNGPCPAIGSQGNGTRRTTKSRAITLLWPTQINLHPSKLGFLPAQRLIQHMWCAK